MSRLDLPSLGSIELGAPIGVGGFAEVRRATLASGRAVAVKRFLRPFESETDRRRFERECRLLADLHAVDGVVELLGSGVVDGHGHLVTPLYAGTVADRVASLGPLPFDEVVAIGRTVAAALVEVHGRGVVHRDLKPSNLFLDDDGGVVIGDFGVASDVAERTITGAAAMSLSYAAPEAVEGEPIEASADLYGLGATLFHLLSGHPPFEATGSVGLGGIVRRIATESAPPVDRPDVPDGLRSLVADLLAKSPAERPPDARSVVQRLDTLDEVAAPAPSRRRRALLTAVLVLLVSGTALAAWRGGDASPDLAVSASERTPSPSTTVTPVEAVGATGAPTTPTGSADTSPVETSASEASVVPATSLPTIGTEPAAVIGSDTIAAPTTDAAPDPTPAPTSVPPTSISPTTPTSTVATTTAAPTTTVVPVALACAPQALLCERFDEGTAAWFEVVDLGVATLATPSSGADDPALALVPSGTEGAEGGAYLRRTVAVPDEVDAFVVRFSLRVADAGGSEWFANVAGVEDARGGVWNVDARADGAGGVVLSGFHEFDGDGAFAAATAIEPGRWSCVELLVAPGVDPSIALVVDGVRTAAPNGIASDVGFSGSVSLTAGAKWLSPADAVPVIELAELAVHPGDPLGCD